MQPMNEEKREAFLARTRLGILTTLKADGAPTAVPIWYDWDGEAVRVFTSKSSPKIKRLQQDPRASMLVVNDVGEPEAWVLFEGEVTIQDSGTTELMRKLAYRYWDMTQPAYQKTLENWVANDNGRCLLTLKPQRIRSSG